MSIPTLFLRKHNGPVVPVVNPSAAWVFEVPSIACDPSRSTQYSDVQVLDLHELSVTEGYEALKRVLDWLPVDEIIFEHPEDHRQARILRSDFV